MINKNMFYAILFSCNRIEPKVMIVNTNFNAMIAQIAKNFEVDPSDLNIYKIEQDAEDADDDLNDIPFEVSEIPDEHMISFLLNEEQKGTLFKNYTSCLACTHCKFYISVFKTTNDCINFFKLMEYVSIV